MDITSLFGDQTFDLDKMGISKDMVLGAALGAAGSMLMNQQNNFAVQQPQVIQQPQTTQPQVNQQVYYQQPVNQGMTTGFQYSSDAYNDSVPSYTKEEPVVNKVPQNTITRRRPTNFKHSVELTQSNTGIQVATDKSDLHKLQFYLSWESVNTPCDLDIQCFGLKGQTVLSNQWFVYYNNKQSPNNAIRLLNASDGIARYNEELIELDLDLLDDQIDRLVFTITIDKAREKNQTFNAVTNCCASIIDIERNRELGHHNLSDTLTNNVYSAIAGELINSNGWILTARYAGTYCDLRDLCRQYGVNIED